MTTPLNDDLAESRIKCRECGRIKTVDNFWNDVNNGKPRHWCKECMRKYSTKWYRDHKDIINQRRRKSLLPVVPR